MKTLYLNGDCNIVVDTEQNTVGRLNAERCSIRDIYLAEEPMHVIYECGETREEVDVKKGDIVIVFYHNTFKTEMIVVKNNKQWSANIIDYNKREQKQKEAWAKINADNIKSESESISR